MSRRLRKFGSTLLIGVLALSAMNLFLTPNRVWAQGPGSLETTFNSAVGTAFANVTALATDSSGNIYVGYSSSVKKISSAGALVWTSSTGYEPYSIAIDSQSRVLVGTRSGVRRISSTGAADSTYNCTSGATCGQLGVGGVNAEIYSVAYQVAPDRTIFLSNFFNNARRLGGLTSTGAEDSAFTQNSLTTTSAAMALDSNNNIYVVGPSGMGYLKRFSATGTTTANETTFASNVSGKFDAAPTAVAVDASNNVYVVGNFTGKVKKFSSTGVEDTTFNTNAAAAALPNGALTVTVQTDGKVIVGGSFSGNLKRFNTNGTLDSTFVYDNATGGTVNDAVVLSDGYILVGTASSPFVKKVYTVFLAPNTPGTPTAVAGDARVTVTVTAPTSGVTPSGYIVTTVQDNSKTCTVTGASGSCTISGLINGNSYTFTSVALNGDKTSTSSSAASSAVTPIGVPPVFQSAAIDSAGTTLTMTYNEELNSTTAPTTQFTVVVGGQPATVSAVTVSGSTVQLTMSEVVIQGQTVTVAYAAPASTDSPSNLAIQDALGMDALSFSTTSVTNGSLVDRTAPIYESVANTSAGTTITLTYNENLSTTTALASAFTVTNGGEPIAVSSVATASGTKTVVLTLASPVGQGKVVTVAYAAPTTDGTTANNAIQDVAGNDALSFTAKTLTNSSSVDQTGPVFSWGSLGADGRTLTLNYGEIVRDPRAPASAFTVMVDGSPVTVSSVAANGNAWTAILTLESPVGSGKAVTVAYSAPTADAAPTNAAIQDTIGNDALSFSATSVTNSSGVDQTPPVYSTSSLAANGLSLTVTYNENLHKTSLPLAGSFTVLSNGSPISVSSVAAGPNTTTGNRSVVLTLGSVIGSGRTVTVAYEAPTVNNATTNTAIQDLTGNDAPSLTAASVSNGSTVDQTSPVLSSASLAANGLTLTLNYNETLRDPRAAASTFTVLVNGSPVTVSSVAASGSTSTVVLTLATAVGSGKAVTVAYSAPAVDAGTTNAAIQDTTGNDAASFSATTVTNGSTVDQTAPVISSAVLGTNGTTLTLTYNETIRSTTATTGDFVVTVDGNPVTISSVVAPGTNGTVVLTLASVVANDKTLTVSYVAPTADAGTTNAAIQDTSGNDADSLSARSVTNNSTVDTLRPTISTATVLSSGTLIDITFSEVISCTISADSAFTITVNGSPVTLAGFNRSCPSNKITASLSGVTITSNQTVTVSYTAPADDSSPSNAALQDATGNDMLSVSGITATNNSSVAPDLRAPIFTSAVTNTAGTLITLTYDEALISTTAPASAYTVTINGVDFQPSGVAISGSTVQLTMGTAIEFGKTVTVSYNAPTPNALASNSAVQDSSGNDSISQSNAAVSNFSTAGPDVTPPTLSTISASGTTVTLTFNETLGSVTADSSRYTVFVGNDPVTVSAALVSGSTVVLTLASSVPSGELVSVTYAAPTSNSVTSNAAIQDYAGNDAASFSGNNRTTSTAWSWVAGSPSNNTSCTGSRYANSERQRALPNGVTYSVAVSGPYVCMFEASESLSQRGGTTSNFTKTGLITDPGAFIASLEPGTTSGDTNCTLYTMGTTLSKCLNRGFVTMTFSEPTLNPVISFAGWGGADGGAKSWSELELVTPGVTLTMLSGTNLQVVGGTYVGVVDPSPGTRCTNSIPAGCGSLQVNGTVTEVKFALNYNSNGTGWGNEDQWNMVASVVEDFGQLPVGYDSPAASHVVGHLKLGSVVTADNLNVLYGTTNADAVSAGAAIPANEDGVSSLAALGDADAGKTYSLPVSLSGVERTAKLCGWIDFNRDGTMSLAERTCATNPAAGATSATLSWTVPSDIVAGLTYARIRLSYDAVPIPTGKVSSGEVEDYSFIIASNAIPSAVNDTSTNAQDINQIISPLVNDSFEDGVPADNSKLFLCGYGSGPFVCDKTSLTVPNQGTYTVNSNGTVTFDPLPNYVGTATPVQYQISDTQDRARTATITPTVTPSPTASADTTSDYVNITQSKDVLTNDAPGVGVFSMPTVKLCSSGQTPSGCSATTVSVTGGVYTLNTSTGVITFTPATDWVGTATPVTYQVADGSGQVASSTYTPTVVSRPTAANDTSSDDYDVTQTISPLLNDAPGGSPLAPTTLKLCGIDNPATPDTNESESPNSCTKTTLTIPGEGTYTVNSDGTVTFDPLPTFYGTASSRPYQISDALGETASANITASVGTPPLPIARANTSTGDYDVNQTLSPLDGDTAGSSSFPFDVSSIKLCGLADNTATPAIPAETPNGCTQTTVVVPGEGTYTLNTSTGEVTFDPLPSFTGQAQTPVTYQVKDSLDRYVNSTLTPTVGPPPLPQATADALTRGYDTNHTYTPLGNDTAGAADFPLLATSVKLCGIDPVQTPNSCDKTTLTVPGEGTYTVNSDGTVTFDPLPTFTGQVQTPVRYQAKDSLDRFVNSTITPTVGPPPTPQATADVLTRDYDTNHTYTPLGNDTAGAADFPLLASSVKLCGLADPSADPVVVAETPNNCTKTSVTVPGEGTYTVNSDGTVTFDPLPTFTGQVQTPVRYQANDSLLRYVNTTIAPTVGPPPVPQAAADALTRDYDTNHTYTPLGNDTAGAADFPLLATSVKLCGLADATATPPVTAETPDTCSQSSVTVPGEGTYTVNPDGTVTFDPLPTFTGQVQTPVRYQANDSQFRYVNSTITPTVGPPPVPQATADALTRDYDTNHTYTPLSNDTNGATDFPLLASSVKLCGLDPAETPNNCTQTSLTVSGEGTYTVNSDGTVTFDPLPSFTGQVQTPVRYQAKDSLDRFVNTTITPTVGPPPVPTASPDAITTDYDTNQTYTPLGNDTRGAADFPLLATSVKLCGLDDPATIQIDEAESPNTCSQTSLTVPGEGTYTVNSDGTVSFDPLPTFTGPVQTPVRYQANDSLDRYVNTTITPTIGLPPIPTASPDAIRDSYDKNQPYSPLANDTPGVADFPLLASSVKLCGLADAAATPPVAAEIPNDCSKTSLTVPGEGTYTVNEDGTVTFNPLPTFTGTVATPVTYQANDSLNRFVSATITPRVDPPTAPSATPETQSVLPGATATYTTVVGASGLGTGTGLQAGSTNGPCLVDPVTELCGTSVNIPGEGTWTINQTTGVATFAASSSIAPGTRTSVTYRITDITGQTATSTLTPVVPPAPDVKNDTSTDAYDTNQVIDILDNDDPGHSSAPLVASTVKLCGIDPLQTPNNCTQTSVTVPGEGTYTVNPDGTVTFNPLDTFAGTVTRPVTYQVADTLGQIDSATITPTVTPPPLNVVNDTSSGLYDTNQVIPVLTNDTPGAQWVPSTVKLCRLADATATPAVTAETAPNCTQTSVTVPGEGTYTVNPDGTVTFNPLPSFTGQAQTPVTYQVTDILGRTDDATITPTVGPPPLPTASPDALTRAYDTDQTYTPLGNDTPGAADFPFVASSLKLCGIDPLQTPNNCTQTSLTVPGEGTYTVNPDGTVTFDPLPTFVGQVATSVKYQAKDSLDRFVNTTITPTVLPPPLPTASPDAITTDYDTNQTYTPLGNDTPGAADFPLLSSSVKLCGLDPVQTPNNCTQTSLTVPGEGTYTVNGDGTVTFNPLPTFVGQVATPVKYQAKDSLDRFVNTTITPTILPPPIPTAEPDAITDDYDKNQTYTPLANDPRGATDFPLLASSVKLCGIDPVQTPNSCDKTSVTVPGEGTYTVNPDGTVTFNPLDSFAGTVRTPVTYQAKDSLNRFVDETITPTVTPPPINVVNDTSTGLYDINQVIPVLTNDTPGAEWVPSTVKLCRLADATATPAVTAETAPNCTQTSVTVPGEGTYTVNPDGTVTFNPLPSFTGQAQTPVTYQVTDILGRTEDATITPTVGPPPLPTASPDALTRAYDTDQTYTPLGNDTPGAADFPFVASSLKLCGIDPAETPNNCTQTSLTVPGEGTYTVNPDGTVTFDPLPTFVGQVATSVKYQAKDSLDRFVNTTITPTVLPPPLPTASPDAITTDYDTNQTYTPLGNDTAGAADFPLLASSVKLCGIDPAQTPNNCTQTSLTVPGEGTYTVNPDGTVTFNPLPTFVGQVATPVKYQAKDSLDRFVNTTITPTILPPPAPTAQPDAITDDYDKNQTYTPLANDPRGATDFPLLASSVKLCGIDPVQTPNNCTQTSLIVPGEGTYTVNPDGTVTFNPLDSFAGTVTTPVTYQAKDSLNRFVDETITPTVTPPPINVVNDTSTGLYDTNQVIPVLTNDTPGAQWVASTVKLCGLDPLQTPNSCDKTSVTVPGEGTYTVNPDGSVTFNPLPSFTGQAQTPVTYQVTDILGRTEDATITPTVGPPPSPTASPDALTRAYDTDQTYTPLGNDTRGAADFPFAASSLKLCGIDPLQTPNNCTQTSLTVPGEGTYTVNPDGTVTFDPLPTFVGQVATPVKYQAKDSLDRFVNTTITPTVLPPPVPSASPDAITTDYDTNQTYTPLGNDTAGAADFPLLASSVKLCGIDPAQTPNSCDKTSLTVPGEGTYAVNSDGTVTFNPLPTFVGQVATPVKYQAKDSLDRYVNTTITPTILPPPIPTAEPDAITDDYDKNQTYTPLANDPRGATDFPLLASSVKLCGIDPVQTPNSCDKTSVTVPGEGTYTVNPDGTVTFNPLPTFVGQVATPVTYQAKDSLNRFVDETITPTILPPPLPTAQPDAITTDYDTNQTYTPLANDPAGATSFPLLASSVKLCGIDDTATVGVDEAEIPNNCTQTSLTVPGEGTYTVNPDGTVTFNPLPTFVGEVATPVTYQAKDSLNRFVDETITPTILPPPLPRALPDAITTDYDTNQTYTPLANDPAGATDFPLVVSSLKLCGIDPVQTPNNCTQTSLTVPGEGTYTVNGDGTVTFNPLPTFVGQVATSVKYQAKDSLDRFVNTTITPTILPPPLPTAEPDAITTDYDTNQTYTPLGNDRAGAADFPLLASSLKLCGVSPVQTPNNCTQTSLTVPGEGTYTVNSDGTVTFNPLPTFVGQVATPVTYQAKDSLNRFVDETITPTILPPPAPTATPDAITDDYDKNQTYTPLANDTRGATDFPLLASSVKLCGIDPVQTPNNCTQTSLIVPGEGTYTVNPDGTVTFDPLPTFTGTVATPVKYQAKDSLNRFVNTTITPTVTAPAITVVDDTKTGPYDTNQTIAVLTNDIPSAQWAPSSVKLCGIDPVETPNNCTQTSLTVPGEGTYTVNPDGTVTFDPLPTFVGPVATPVTYQVTDVLGRTADADIRPTVLLPPPPIATPETRVVVPSGTAVFTNVIGTSALASGVQLQTGATNGPCLVGPATTFCGTTVVIDGEGTWTIDRTTGVATFVAEAGIATGPRTPVTYRVTDFAGQTATSTLRPIVPPPPSATDDFSSGPFDTNQSLTPFSNDSFDSLAPVRATSLKLCAATETPNSCSQPSVVVPNEGTYTVNSDGTVTFDPLPTFFGAAAPLPYQAEDIYGRFVDATLNPSVSRPNAPVALPETKVVLPGGTISFTNVIGASALASGAQLQSGATNGPCLVDPATSLCGTTVVIDGEGTWTIDQTTGVATFVAEPEITVGTKTPVTYRVTDAVGQTASSTLTPIVPPPPTAANDAQTSPLDINQTYTPLSNDSFSSLAVASPSTLRLCGAGQTPNNCDKTTVVVANEGTYTAYSDGRVIFDPLPTFTGTATPITYQVADIYGRTVNATITPTILPPPIPAATLDTGKAKEGKTVVLTPWLNDSAGVVVAGQTGKASLVPTSIRLCPINTVAAKDVLTTGQADPACTLMKIKTADGTYTVDPKTGKVTFVHRKGFIGEVTQPVPYQIATDWKIPSGVLTARSMLIPTIMPLRTPMVTIGDRVWRDVNGDGYQSKADRGIPGVKVTLRTASGEVVVDINGSEVGPQFTDKKGKYKFTDLPSGRYKVTVEYPKGFEPTIANRKGREKNSSTRSALSRELVLGQSDNSLDFGMVGRRKPGLAHTT